jgi:hypothetical protein
MKKRTCLKKKLKENNVNNINDIKEIDNINDIKKIDDIKEIDNINNIKEIDNTNNIKEIDNTNNKDIINKEDIINNEVNTTSSYKNANKDIKKIFTQKELCYYKMIDNFFTEVCTEQKQKMIDIVNRDSKISTNLSSKLSLRLLDFFVTKNTRKNSQMQLLNDEYFDIKISYKSQLKAYKKRYFDPFRRRKKFIYKFKNTENNLEIKTTLGQLNFFKWAFSNNIIDYVEANIIQISNDMVVENKKKKTLKILNKVKLTKVNETDTTIKTQKKPVEQIKKRELHITLNFD